MYSTVNLILYVGPSLYRTVLLFPPDLTVDEESPQSLREAVVLVMSGGEWASGMLLSDTVVLTCHHVVNNDKGSSCV